MTQTVSILFLVALQTLLAYMIARYTSKDKRSDFFKSFVFSLINPVLGLIISLISKRRRKSHYFDV